MSVCLLSPPRHCPRKPPTSGASLGDEQRPLPLGCARQRGAAARNPQDLGGGGGWGRRSSSARPALGGASETGGAVGGGTRYAPPRSMLHGISGTRSIAHLERPHLRASAERPERDARGGAARATERAAARTRMRHPSTSAALSEAAYVRALVLFPSRRAAPVPRRRPQRARRPPSSPGGSAADQNLG